MGQGKDGWLGWVGDGKGLGGAGVVASGGCFEDEVALEKVD